MLYKKMRHRICFLIITFQFVVIIALAFIIHTRNEKINDFKYVIDQIDSQNKDLEFYEGILIDQKFDTTVFFRQTRKFNKFIGATKSSDKNIQLRTRTLIFADGKFISAIPVLRD